jgi:hypothetical protein
MHRAPPFAAHQAPDGRGQRRWQAFYQEREIGGMELLDATLDLRRLLAEHQGLDQCLLVGRLLGRQFLDERLLVEQLDHLVERDPQLAVVARLLGRVHAIVRHCTLTEGLRDL